MKTMNPINPSRLALVVLASLGLLGGLRPAAADEPNKAPEGWTTGTPRDEIRPEFGYDPVGGPDGQGCLVIKADSRDGLDGWWEKTVPVQGGKYYHFAARYRAKGVAVPRR